MITKNLTFILNTIADIKQQAQVEGVKLTPSKLDKIREQVSRDMIDDQDLWDHYWAIISDAITEVNK